MNLAPLISVLWSSGLKKKAVGCRKLETRTYFSLPREFLSQLIRDRRLQTLLVCFKFVQSILLCNHQCHPINYVRRPPPATRHTSTTKYISAVLCSNRSLDRAIDGADIHLQRYPCGEYMKPESSFVHPYLSRTADISISRAQQLMLLHFR